MLHITVQITTTSQGVETLATLGIFNDGSGYQHLAAYDWLMRYESSGEVVRGHLENFDRRLGWEELLRRVLDAKAELDERRRESESSPR